MTTVKILDGQTIADIAVQELGDAERSTELANLNNMAVTDDLVSGSLLLVPDPESDKTNIVQLFSDPANAPASADSAGGLVAPLEGIGYWYLENDFVVQ